MCESCRTIIFLLMMGLMSILTLISETRIAKLEKENRHLKSDRRFLEAVIEMERSKEDERE